MTKIVQTFWNAQKGDILLNAGGYACPEIHWMSWALSCLQLRKFYPDVEMYSDQAGKELFELLGLPYTKIHTVFDNDEFIQNCPPELWAFSKIHTYSIQDKPFLHVDGDVFIWKPFDEKLLHSPLIAQNVEDNLPIYTETLKIIEKEADFLPDWFYYAYKHPKAHNAGIFGGTNTEFFKKYAEIAREFYQKNIDKLPEINKKSKCLNLIIEQYMFYVLSEQLGVPVSVFDEKDICEQKEYQRFCEISKVPYEYTYVHTLGDAKKMNIVNNFINFILKEEYPEYWHRIINIFKERDILSPFFKHQFEMQDEKTKIITPLVPKPIKDYESTKKLCDFLGINFENLKNKKTDNPVIFDFFEFNEQQVNYSVKQYNKLPINNIPFPLYKKEISVFKEKDFEDYYIFVNPYHEIISSKYNWSKIFSDGTDNGIKDASPEKYLSMFYLDLEYLSFNTFELNDYSIALIEDVKSTPTKIRSFIAKNIAKGGSEEEIIELLKNWLSYGIIYLSKNPQEFIPQQQSEVYVKSRQNLNTQISSCLKQILNHYNVDINNDKITQCDNREVNISLIEITKVLEELDFETKAVRGNWDSLSKIPLPAIAFINLRKYLPLYCVIKTINNEHVTVFNPEQKEEETYRKSVFLEMWEF